MARAGTDGIDRRAMMAAAGAAALTPAQAALSWDRRLQGDPDTVIDMEVMRGAERIPIKLVLKDWL